MADFIYESEDTKEITKALIAFDENMPNLSPDASGNYGDYLSKNKLIAETKIELRKQGLRLSTHTQSVDGHMWLVTTIKHTSGQFIRSAHYYASEIQRDGNAMKVLGGLRTYILRYDISGLLNIDDYTPDLEQERITKAQSNELYEMMKDHKDIQKQFLEAYKITHTDQLLSSKFESAKKGINKLLGK